MQVGSALTPVRGNRLLTGSRSVRQLSQRPRCFPGVSASVSFRPVLGLGPLLAGAGPPTQAHAIASCVSSRGKGRPPRVSPHSRPGFLSCNCSRPGWEP